MWENLLGEGTGFRLQASGFRKGGVGARQKMAINRTYRTNKTNRTWIHRDAMRPNSIMQALPSLLKPEV
jgi:hypothetical protein